jgi:hypothetical protein
LVGANLGTATLGRGEGVDEGLTLVDEALLAQRSGQIDQDLAQHLLLAPALETAVHRLVVGVALREHVPLRAGVQDPQHRIEHVAGRGRLAARATFGDVLLWEVRPDQLPLRVAQLLHTRDCESSRASIQEF